MGPERTVPPANTREVDRAAASLLLLKQQGAARNMQYKGQIVPPAEHAGSIILRIPLLICHSNDHCHRLPPCSRVALPERSGLESQVCR